MAYWRYGTKILKLAQISLKLLTNSDVDKVFVKGVKTLQHIEYNQKEKRKYISTKRDRF